MSWSTTTPISNGDKPKSDANVAKHGVPFGLARFVFNDPLLRVRADDRKDYGEDRFKAVGEIAGDLYAVVFTRREAAIRLISARRANRREREAYEADARRNRA